MDALKKFTLKSLQKNRKRTVVTIVGIILAAALITAVANMAESFRASFIAYQRAASGDYHYCFQGVEQENLKYFLNNRNIERIGYEEDLGYAMLPESTNPDKPYLFVKAMDAQAVKSAALKLAEGRMPETEEEVVVSRHIWSNGEVDIAIGDVLELEIGRRDADGHSLGQSNPYSYEAESFVGMGTKTYTVVGIMERPKYGIEPYTAPGYTIVTLLKDGINSSGAGSAGGDIGGRNLYVTYTQKALKDKDRVTAGLLGVSEELYHEYKNGRISTKEWEQIGRIASNLVSNEWLIKWQLLDFSNNTMNILYSMAGIAVVIIIVTSAFCIHNSFMISLSEKMRLYGMLSSMGATRKQRRKMVYTEAAYLGAAGIPLGVLCGAAATFAVVKLTSPLMVTAMGMELVYAVSLPAMAAGAALSIVTIFLSAGKAARKAGKLSPISAIQGTDTIKIKAGQLRVPGFIHRFFGIGGTIAYKNLRRSRGKYRTTVVSIVVSVSVFIAMTTFVRLAFRAGDIYYESSGYQLSVDIGDYNGENYRKALEIARMQNVAYAEVQRTINGFRVQTAKIPFTDKYREDYGSTGRFDADAIGITIVSLGEDAYKAYCQKVGVEPEQAEGKAILVADYSGYVNYADRRSRYVEGMRYDYHPGDIMTGILMDDGRAETEKEISIELAAQTDVRPLRFNRSSGLSLLVVSDAWMDRYEDYISGSIAVYIQCRDAGALETEIRNSANVSHMRIFNAQQVYEEDRAVHLLIAIFLYGFIAVIALIGITNIFNTVTTNMELRAREFAMLKSIGMTGKEFRRLIQLESLFYGVKALAVGVPLGLMLSLCFHGAMAQGIDTAFEVPLGGIGISVLAVFLLLYVIMKYSMGKIGAKSMIETIQNENI